MTNEHQIKDLILIEVYNLLTNKDVKLNDKLPTLEILSSIYQRFN